MIANVPSRRRFSGLWKYRWSSVNASGPSNTAFASTRASTRPLPSVAVSDNGGVTSSTCWYATDAVAAVSGIGTISAGVAAVGRPEHAAYMRNRSEGIDFVMSSVQRTIDREALRRLC